MVHSADRINVEANMKKIMVVILSLILALCTGCAVEATGTQKAYELRNQLSCSIDSTKAAMTDEQNSSNDTVRDSIDRSVDTSYASFYDTYDIVQYAGIEFQIQKVETVDSLMALSSYMDAQEADEYVQQLMVKQAIYNEDGTLINDSDSIVLIQCRIKNMSTDQKYIYMKPFFYGIRTADHLCYASSFWSNAFTGRNDSYTPEHLTKAVEGYHQLESGEEFISTFICIGSANNYDENQVFGLYGEGISTYMSGGFLANESGGNSKLSVGEPLIKIFSN